MHYIYIYTFEEDVCAFGIHLYIVHCVGLSDLLVPGGLGISAEWALCMVVQFFSRGGVTSGTALATGCEAY